MRGLEVGTAVAGGVIRFGELEVQVNFVVRHVTHGDGNAYEYGVQIYTVNDQDRNEMAALISRFERDLQMI